MTWGGLDINEREALIPECLHDKDKPWLVKDAPELEAEVEI